VARANPRAEAHHPEHGAVGKRGDADVAGRAVGAAVIVDREAFARPDHGGLGAGPRLGDVLNAFVDRHNRSTALIMAGDDAADVKTHRMCPCVILLWAIIRRTTARLQGAARARARRRGFSTRPHMNLNSWPSWRPINRADPHRIAGTNETRHSP